jgi:putative ABC transport system permease protein
VKFLHLILSALLRRKTRTIFTLLSVLAAFLLFGLLDSVRSAFASAGQDIAGVDRLVTVSRISFELPLPKSLLERIEATPGVAGVSYANWFGGVYQDPKNFFANEAVAPNFMDLYPEWRLTVAERAAFRDTRTGAVVGERLASKFHWKLGRRAAATPGPSIWSGSSTRAIRSRGIRRMCCSSIGIISMKRARSATAPWAGT